MPSEQRKGGSDELDEMRVKTEAIVGRKRTERKGDVPAERRNLGGCQIDERSGREDLSATDRALSAAMKPSPNTLFMKSVSSERARIVALVVCLRRSRRLEHSHV
jgi:hypothetical protein